MTQNADHNAVNFDSEIRNKQLEAQIQILKEQLEKAEAKIKEQSEAIQKLLLEKHHDDPPKGPMCS